MSDSMQCSKCDQEFTDEDTLKTHLTVDHASNEATTIQTNLHRQHLPRGKLNFPTDSEPEDEDQGVPTTGSQGYNTNPNAGLYDNKLFRTGSSTERTSILGERAPITDFETQIWFNKNWDELTDEEKRKAWDLKDKLEYGESFQSSSDVLDEFIDQMGDTSTGFYDWQSFAQAKGLSNYEIDKQWDDWGLDSLNHNNDRENINTIIRSLRDPNLRAQYEDLIEESYASEGLEDNWNLYTPRPVEMSGEFVTWLKDAGLYDRWNGSTTENERIHATQQYQNGVPASDYQPYSYESDVDYEKENEQSMGFIEQQHTEPKEDKDEKLDKVDISLEKIDYVYKTKGSESEEKDHVTDPVEGLDEEYAQLEDSQEDEVKSLVESRKLHGYSNEHIAKELHIIYGISKDRALEKVYSVEVSNNDKVAQTFFGKMYKDCTESEKSEMRMYSGSDY